MVEGETPPSEAAATETAARMTSSFVKIGDRTRFTVELRPGETTIVSWKKLMKDVVKAQGGGGSGGGGDGGVSNAPQPASNSIPNLESRLAPGQPIANELNDAPAPNRFNAVIEKIERLYTGKDSSDEEDLDDIPDDDQYDTEDSFIDDAELDEYFEVDKSKIKHDGYFVNRGMLEKLNEPSESANQQPKKRRRKEVSKVPGINLDDQRGSKHLKPGKKGAGKSTLSSDKTSLTSSQGPSKISEESKVQNHEKIGTDSKPSLNPVASLGTSHGDMSENCDKQKIGTCLAKTPSGKVKDSSENGGKCESTHESKPLKQNHVEGSESLALKKDKTDMRERIDLNLPDNKQPVKNSVLHKKESSSVKSKANALEKAIRELEKMVAESRPPTSDAQDGDPLGQCIKRRLPREIKQKLAKVARLAHATHGTLSKELLSRLMSIFGHLMQIRTLKRHLKVMVTTGLTAKQEKDDKFQQAKKEVTEMIKARIPSLISKTDEIQGVGSGEVQESIHSENSLKGQLYMDTTLEDKICDLYDIFVDGLDEDATPQVRKLYAELAELWPKGVMDNHGIKRAICHAKERKRTLNEKNKDQEKVRRKRVQPSITEETARVESSSAVQSQYVDIRVVSDPTLPLITPQNRFSTLTTTTAPPTPTPTTAPPTPTPTAPINASISTSASIPSTNVPHLEYMKQEEVKTNQNQNQNNHNQNQNQYQPFVDGRIVDVGVKKKVKKRAENLMGELPLRPQKPPSQQVDDTQKQHKHVPAQIQGPPPPNSSYSEFRFEPLT